LWWSQLLTTATVKVIQQQYGWHCLDFVLMCGLLGKLLILMGALLCFLNNTKYLYFQWTRKSDCSKINPTDQFDHASIKNGYKRDLKWLLGCFNR